MYSVNLSSRAAKEIEACPRDMKERLLKAVEDLASDPRPPGSRKLWGMLAGSWRIRVGAYRVLCDVYDRERRVLVTKVGPRKSVYR